MLPNHALQNLEPQVDASPIQYTRAWDGMGGALLVGLGFLFLGTMLIAYYWRFHSVSNGPGSITVSAIHALMYWSLAWLGLAVLATGGLLVASYRRAPGVPGFAPRRSVLGATLVGLMALAALVSGACGESVETRIDAGAQEVSVRTHFLFRADELTVHSTRNARAVLFFYHHGLEVDYAQVHLLDAAGRRIAEIGGLSTISFDRELTQAVSALLGLPIRCEEVGLLFKDFYERCDPDRVPTY